VIVCGFDSHLGYSSFAVLDCLIFDLQSPPMLQIQNQAIQNPKWAVAPMVKRTITPRFERGVPGSSPGRGAFRIFDS
jgi:hypothetical protein